MEQLKRELFALLREKGAALCGKCFAVCPYTQRWLRSSQDQPRL
jgi:epoxyqueuosine reductase QueG